MEKALKQMDLEFCGNGKHKISPEKFLESQNVLFLDVRDKNELITLRFDFKLFGIDSLNIPIEELPDRLEELPTDKTIVCFCSSGTRSAWAYIYLFSKGFDTKWLAASNEDIGALLKPGRILKATKNK
ncbi:MAG TPA: rhodanese-like domain-containing protein [Bacteroidetes bacterium]|nr:rhodanese-like domain-containing protein [Bacteroidota bacterium]